MFCFELHQKFEIMILNLSNCIVEEGNTTSQMSEPPESQILLRLIFLLFNNNRDDHVLGAFIELILYKGEKCHLLSTILRGQS